jgi:hypothetical protein
MEYAPKPKFSGDLRKGKAGKRKTRRKKTTEEWGDNSELVSVWGEEKSNTSSYQFELPYEHLTQELIEIN